MERHVRHVPSGLHVATCVGGSACYATCVSSADFNVLPLCTHTHAHALTCTLGGFLGMNPMSTWVD